MVRIPKASLAAVTFFVAGVSGASAQNVYKIGAALGLTGYGAVTDRAWRDGQILAIEQLNARGGLLGRKIEYVPEDNRSEPQEAVVVYRKMLSNDRVNIFGSGCISAGNFAAAGFVVRAQLPMVLCSILPPRPEEQKWSFSTLPPPRFEMETRYRYLKEKTDIRKVGIMHDPTPYAMMMRDVGVKVAQEFGIEIVAVEAYKPDDSDMSVQVGRINGAGAGAIIKMGQGGATVTIAKNVKQLGLDKMLLLASVDDGTILKAAGEVLDERFLFVAAGVQVPESIPAGPARDAAGDFLKVWRAKYGDRDTYGGSRGWDSITLIAKAVEGSKSFEGPAVRDAIEKINLQGAFARYNFSPEQHVGITENPYIIGVLRGGKLAMK